MYLFAFIGKIYILVLSILKLNCFLLVELHEYIIYLCHYSANCDNLVFPFLGGMLFGTQGHSDSLLEIEHKSLTCDAYKPAVWTTWHLTFCLNNGFFLYAVIFLVWCNPICFIFYLFPWCLRHIHNDIDKGLTTYMFYVSHEFWFNIQTFHLF